MLSSSNNLGKGYSARSRGNKIYYLGVDKMTVDELDGALLSMKRLDTLCLMKYSPQSVKSLYPKPNGKRKDH